MPSRTSDGHADWGVPLWQVDLTLPDLPPPTHCDVAVIGGGFTGLSAAYHLAQRGCRVALFEGGRIGDGASGRTGGLALEGTAQGPLPEVEHCLAALAAVTEEAGIDCDLTLDGCWEIAHADTLATDGIRWRDGERVLRIERTVAGGTVDPGKLVAGLARAARDAGAAIHQCARVRRLLFGAEPRLELDSGAVCTAAHVVVALNGYTGELLSLHDELRAPLTLALSTAPVDERVLEAIGLADRRPFYTVDLPYLWGRCTRDRRIVFGAGLVFPADGDVRDVDIRHAESSAAFTRLEQRIRGLDPALADVTITHQWGGPIAFRAGATPLLGALSAEPRVLVTGAYAGHGVALSIRIGQLIAGAIADRTPLPTWGTLPT